MKIITKIKYYLAKTNKIILLSITLLCAFAAVMSCYFMLKPLYLKNEIQLDLISQKTSYAYKVRTLPNSIKEVTGKIFPKSQEIIYIDVSSTVASLTPATVSGKYSIKTTLIADGLWEKVTYSIREHEFEIKGTDIEIFDQRIQINVKDILDELDVIGTHIVGVRPGKYTLKVTPQIKGNVLSNDQVVPLDLENELVFDFNNNQVMIAVDQKMEYSKSTPLSETQLIKQYVKLFDDDYEIAIFRIIFPFAFFLLSLFLILILLAKKSLNNIEVKPVFKDDKKFRNRFIIIEDEIDIASFKNIPINPLKALVAIADEKDEFILKYTCENEKLLHYYVVVGDYLYTHDVRAS